MEKDAKRQNKITENGKAKKSRYANPAAQLTLCQRLGGPDEERSAMQYAFSRLSSAQKFSYPKGLSEAEISRHPKLEPFVHWTAENRSGISIRKSGGKYNSAEYTQVGVSKNVKFQAHKLSCALKLGVLYTDMEHTGLESSHLCHMHQCWRPDHMCGESHALNVKRNSGIGCAGYIYDSMKHTLLELCSHEPKCMHIRIVDDLQSHSKIV